ncbi:MAG: hypothetical protein HQ519_04345 [Planctomycetes bacterium]|nr:hypothetical protein [Planctomycetota bacterium]
MNSYLHRLALQRRALVTSLITSGLFGLFQVVIFLLLTDTMLKILHGDPTSKSSIPGVGLISTILLLGPISAWASVSGMLSQNKDWVRFVSQLPVTAKQINRLRLRADLLLVFAPLALSMAMFMVAALLRDSALGMAKIELCLLSGVTMGFALFAGGKRLLGGLKKNSILKPIIPLLRLAGTVAPLVLAVLLQSVFLSILFLALGGLIIWGLWQSQVDSITVAPANLLEAVAVAGFTKIPMDPKASTTFGKHALNRWLWRHMLFARGAWAIALFVALDVIFDGRGFDFSLPPTNLPMVLFFMTAIIFGASLVTKKVEFLPIPRRRIFPFLVLPTLGVLLVSALASEGLNYLQAPFKSSADAALAESDPPIRFGFGTSIANPAGSAQQIIVPPQMLEVKSAGFAADPKTQSAGIPWLWSGGPVLFNPYGVPEPDGDNLNVELISQQLHRALFDFYGASPSPESIRAEYFSEFANKSFFKPKEFAAWQHQFAQQRQGQYEDQSLYWKRETVQFLPARLLGWVMVWAIAVIMALTLRLRFVNRRREIIRRTVWTLTAIVIFCSTLFAPLLTWGSGIPRGFGKRLDMMPTHMLRELLPSNFFLAWLTVLILTALLYHILLNIFERTVWVDLTPSGGSINPAYQKWVSR